jgi:hypothetical protein
LGKHLIDDAAWNCIHAPDDPVLASDMINKNNPVPKYSQPIKALQFAFERSNVPFFLFQILEAASYGLALLGSQ